MLTSDQSARLFSYKTVLLFIVLILSFNLMNAQTTAIPDSNFEDFLIAQGIDTNGANGNILNSDAQAVTNLTVTVTNITDFTGLEAFVNLVVLDLGTNQFPSLPLNTLTELEELIFDDNNALAALDISLNTKLRILDIRGPGSGSVQTITDLDMSNNTLLEHIYIYDFKNLVNVTFPVTDTVTYVYMLLFAPITVDFSMYDNLETLALSTNFNNTLPINVILPSNQNALKSVSFQGGNILNVDLSNFLVLEYISLQSCNTETLSIPATDTLTRIRISSHRIESVSFENAPMLDNLSITGKITAGPLSLDVTKNTQLTTLNASSNKMVSLDVTQCTILDDLNFSSNELTGIDLSQNTLLKNLNGSRNLLTSLDLTHNPVLYNAYLQENQLPNLDVTQNPLLSTLYIGKNLFTGTGLDLTQNPVLRTLNAEQNQIESLDITQNLELSTIILNHNLFSGTDILDQFYAIRLGDDGLLGGTLDVAFNQLTGTVPNFFDMVHLGDNNIWTRRFNLYINDNEFHFGDFEEQHLGYVSLLTTYGPYSTPVFSKYYYAPQAKVNEIETPVRNAGESITLLTEVRGSQNHYQWFKDGVEIADGPDSPELILTDLTDCDSGVYHCEIRSDLVPFENSNPPGSGGKNLLLVRNNITLTVNVNKTCVSLVNPSNGATAVPINTGISWAENPGACGYKVSAGTSSGGTDIVNNEDVGDATLYNFSSDLPNNTDIFVTITPYFADGDLAACSEETFKTNATTTIPDCTSLTTPADGSTDVAVATDLTWNAANAADGYRITAGTSSGGTDILNNVDVGNVTTYDIPADLQENTEIFVRITPYNSMGDATSCTEESFTTEVIILQPSCTNLTLPVNGSTNIAVTTNLSWNSVANAEGYYLSVGTGFGQTDIMNKVDIGNVTTYDLPSNLPEDTEIFVKITPYNTLYEALACSQESFTTGNTSTPAVPSCTSLTMPTNGANNVSINTGLSWNSSTDATGYKLSVGTTSGGTDLVNNSDLGNVTSYAFTGNLPEGTTIYVNLTPYNATGDASGCTEQSFTTATTATVPGCTSLTTPTNGATNVSISTGLSWNSSTDATGYRLSVGTTSGATDLVNNSDMGNVTAYSFTNDLPEGTTIYVNITPYNATGDATGCTEQSFSTSTTATVPGCTSLTTPTNGATNVSISTGLSWNSSTDATGYRLSVGTTSGGTDLVNNSDLGNVTAYSFTNDLPEGTTIYVNITPYNATGDATGCSIQSFTTATTATVPACTSLTTPTNGATNVSVSTGLNWNSITDATGYRLSVGTTSGGTDLVNNSDLGNVTSYSFTSNLPDNTIIYVSITPYNATGDATGCSIQSFTTVTTATVPSCTSLTTPSNGASNVSISTSLSWNSITDATGYRLSVGTTSGGTDLVNNSDLGNVTAYSFTGNLPEGTTIYVNLTPYNAMGDATGCTEQSFNTATTATVPACTSLTTPTNGASNVSVSTDLSWNSSTDATGYRLSVGTTSGGTDLVNNSDLGNVTTYSFTSDLPEGTTIYVNLTPYNATGDATGCTEQSFTTTTTATVPSCTTMTTPTNGATNVSVSTGLSWNSSTDATGYRLSVGTTSGGTDLVNNSDLGNVTSYAFTGNLPEGTTIYVNITPYNATGDATGCTEQSFSTSTTATVPGCTSLTTPTNGATNVSISTGLSWNSSTDATGYRLSVGTTSGGTDLVNNSDLGNVTAYSFTNDLPEGTTIYVNITPYNATGDATSCTEQSFTTATTATVPGCTSLTTPTNGATNVSVSTGLSWNSITDATGYRLSVGTTSGGIDILDNEDVSIATSYNFTMELPQNTTIYVQIIPYNTVGDASDCLVDSFTTELIYEDDTKYGFSPNGDGIRDVWVISNIEQYTNNTVTIYNRWGDMVYQATGYNNTSIVFDGRANKNTQLGAGDLPEGTYYFTIAISGNHTLQKTTGFLVLKR